jgi:hypothetical protein
MVGHFPNMIKALSFMPSSGVKKKRGRGGGGGGENG